MLISFVYSTDSINFDLLSGVSADGVYQASKFRKMMSWGKPKEAKYVGKVVWDPSHWFDLAVRDVKEGKTGSSKDFFCTFIEKTNSFANTLNKGKGNIK